MNWDYFLFFFFYQNPFFSPKSRPVSYLRSSKCVFKLIIQCVNMSDHTVCVLNPSAAGDRITLERIFVVFFCLFRLIHTGSVCVCWRNVKYQPTPNACPNEPWAICRHSLPQTPTALPALDKSSSKSKFPTCLEECNYARTPRCVFSAWLQVVGEDVITTGFSPGLRQQ